MGQTIDYFFAPQSPWAYLGHARFANMVRTMELAVRVLPIDLGKVFAVSGGLPLGKRAPQRQAYRLLELDRFAQHLELPMNIRPKFFPVAGDAAARLIVSVDMTDGPVASLRIAGAVLAAVWVQERNIADTKVLIELLGESGLTRDQLVHSQSDAVQKQYEAQTQVAIDAGVFGSPTYLVAGEMFWGQDRLDFLERRLRPAVHFR